MLQLSVWCRIVAGQVWRERRLRFCGFLVPGLCTDAERAQVEAAAGRVRAALGSLFGSLEALHADL